MTLTSSHPSTASLPASVTVPGGSTTATFTVAHSAVGSPVTVTVTAVAGGVTLTKTLTVNPEVSHPTDLLLRQEISHVRWINQYH